MNIEFGLTDYLDGFVKKVEKPLSRALQLDPDEKADLLVAMLTKDVKDRLMGRQALITPTDFEQVFAMLREEFSTRYDQLLLDLRGLTMASDETLVAFVQRAQKAYVQNQMPLPTTQADLMRVWIQGTAQFIKTFPDELRTRKAVAQHIGLLDKPALGWDENWARLHDSLRQVMSEVSRKTYQPQAILSYELRGLADNSLRTSRTRSGAYGSRPQVSTVQR